MFASLNDIVFEGIKMFTEVNKTRNAIYAEHQTIAGKPKLQFIADGLDELTLSMRFHVSFCNPSDELSALLELKKNAKIVSYIKNDGTIDGSYVITAISESIEQADKDGNIFSLVVNCTLRECSIQDLLKREAENLKESALIQPHTKAGALSEQNNKKTCNALVKDKVINIESHASIIDSTITEKGGLSTIENRHIVLQSLNSTKTTITDLINLFNDATSCIAKDENLKQKTINLKTSAESMYTKTYNSILFYNIETENRTFQSSVKNLKESAQAYIKKSIQRE